MLLLLSLNDKWIRDDGYAVVPLEWCINQSHDSWLANMWCVRSNWFIFVFAFVLNFYLIWFDSGCRPKSSPIPKSYPFFMWILVFDVSIQKHRDTVLIKIPTKNGNWQIKNHWALATFFARVNLLTHHHI